MDHNAIRIEPLADDGLPDIVDDLNNIRAQLKIKQNSGWSYHKGRVYYRTFVFSIKKVFIVGCNGRLSREVHNELYWKIPITYKEKFKVDTMTDEHGQRWTTITFKHKDL